MPALIVPIFFYVLNIGALSKVTHAAAHIDFKAFELPVAVVFAVTGVSRASALVTDIQNGYFDRLMITPVRRLPLLLGLMMADLALVMALAVPVLARGPRPRGALRHRGGGMVLFIVLSGLWGLVFTGLPYAIALKTGNPGAVNASFVLFFPITFLSTTFVPKASPGGLAAGRGRPKPHDLHPGGLRALVSNDITVVTPAQRERHRAGRRRPGRRGLRPGVALPGAAGPAGPGPPALTPYGMGWAAKNAHMRVPASRASDCGPSARRRALGRRGPPGHSWPSPVTAYSSTTALSRHPA